MARRRDARGGEREESAPEASRESYFGADPAAVRPHARLTPLPATAPLQQKKNNKELGEKKKKSHNCNVGETHPSSLGARGRQVKMGIEGWGGGGR